MCALQLAVSSNRQSVRFCFYQMKKKKEKEKEKEKEGGGEENGQGRV